jgi:hypothetical protein
MANSDDPILNNHQISPTLELIDIDGMSSNTLDDYSRTNTRNVSEIVRERSNESIELFECI